MRDLLRSTAILRAPADEGGGGGGGDAGAAAAGASAPTELAATVDGAAASQRAPTSLLDQVKEEPAADAPAGDDAKLGEEKKPGEADGEKKDDAAGEEKAPAVPDYAALTLPEGMDPAAPMTLAFKDAAAKANVAPEVAQSLVDAVAPQMKAALEAPYELWADTQIQWSKDAKADAEIGAGDDATFAKNLGIAKKGLEHFAGPEAAKLQQALAFTGAGNNPEVVRYLLRVGRAVSEGSFVPGNTAASPRSLAEKMYPSMTKAQE